MTVYVHNGDIGTVFELTIKDTDEAVIDVSTAAVKYIYFQDPTGARRRKTAAFTTDGTDGKIQYTEVMAFTVKAFTVANFDAALFTDAAFVVEMPQTISLTLYKELSQ